MKLFYASKNQQTRERQLKVKKRRIFSFRSLSQSARNDRSNQDQKQEVEKGNRDTKKRDEKINGSGHPNFSKFKLIKKINLNQHLDGPKAAAEARLVYIICSLKQLERMIKVVLLMEFDYSHEKTLLYFGNKLIISWNMRISLVTFTYRYSSSWT